MNFTNETLHEFLLKLFGEEILVRTENKDKVLKDIEILKDSILIWHDIRKNPDDLPPEDKYVLNQDGETVRLVDKDENLWYYCGAPDEECYEGAEVLLWCYIPTFNVKREN